MSDDKNEDIGFTEAQQEWIRELVVSQRRDADIPPATTSSSQSGTPVVTSSQSQSAGNIGKLLPLVRLYNYMPHATQTEATP